MKSLRQGTAVFLLICVLGSVVTKNDKKIEDEAKPSSEYKPKLDPKDPHGGVKMGRPSSFCDNGKDSISIDWDPASTEEYTCTEGQRPPGEDKQDWKCTDDVKKPIHHCYPDVLTYEDPLPTSGPHRPLWPKFGEYTYVPVQRWLHSLEHGSVVFLYHPCTDPQEVAKMRTVATGCLRKHVISPYKLIPEGYNFALVAWKCKLLLSQANVSAMVKFVKERALHGPESVASDGQYTVGLTVPATLVSNLYDQRLCPDFQITDKVTKTIAEDSETRKKEGDDADNKVLQHVKQYLEKKGLLFESSPNETPK